MSQLSFFSAESVPPAVSDLTGLLAAAGQIVLVGAPKSQGARLSVVVDRPWRAVALAEMIAECGLTPEISRTDEDTPLVRTAIEPGLIEIAAQWTRGAVKTVPPQWLPGSRELRAWTLAAGVPEGDRYLLGLDPHAPDTHSPLASALMRVGIAPTLIGTHIAVALAHCLFNIPLAVWILEGFMSGVPRELDEAAIVDGYPFWRFFVRIFLPTIAAGIGAHAGRHRPDIDRHQRGPSGTADQWPQEAVSAGREHRGTAGGCRSVRPMAPGLTGPPGVAGLRPPVWSAKLAVARRGRGPGLWAYMEAGA